MLLVSSFTKYKNDSLKAGSRAGHSVHWVGRAHGPSGLCCGRCHAGGERSSRAELTWGAGRRAQLKICICFLVTCLALCVLANSVQSLSCVQLFATPWTAARQASLSITNSWSLPSFMSIESVMPSNHLILCRPLLLPPSIFASIRVFSSESVLHIRWPKY